VLGVALLLFQGYSSLRPTRSRRCLEPIWSCTTHTGPVPSHHTFEAFIAPVCGFRFYYPVRSLSGRALERLIGTASLSALFELGNRSSDRRGLGPRPSIRTGGRSFLRPNTVYNNRGSQIPVPLSSSPYSNI